MADINHSDIKLMRSQNLDDTDEGGGQMTSIEVVNGEVNNLFPDISRLDRTYGRVSIKKAFYSVQTENRATCYGSHVALMKQADDPNVSITMFTTNDWFDRRKSIVSQIERYLALGPQFQAALWGDHYKGSRFITLHAHIDQKKLYISDVLILKQGDNHEYIRIMEISIAIETIISDSYSVKRKVYRIKATNPLSQDYTGTDINYSFPNYNTIAVKLFESVVADASKYYGVMTLANPITEGQFNLKVNDIKQNIVPSAQIRTPITDFGINTTISSMITPNTVTIVEKPASYLFAPNQKIIIGEAVKPGSLSYGSYSDNGIGGFLNSSGEVIGAIDYISGTIDLGNTAPSVSTSGTLRYERTLIHYQMPYVKGIEIKEANRSFTYITYLDPIPVPLTTVIEYMAGGKWYKLADDGSGRLKGVTDDLGTGILNFTTGSLSLSLGYLPDIDSMILITWGSTQKSIEHEFSPNQINHVINFPNQSVNLNRAIAIKWTQNGIDYEINNNNEGGLFYDEDVNEVGFYDAKTKNIYLYPNITPPSHQTYTFESYTPNMKEESYTSISGITLNATAPILHNTVAIQLKIKHTHTLGEHQATITPMSPNTIYTSVSGSSNQKDIIRTIFLYADNSGNLVANENYGQNFLLPRNLTAGTINFSTGSINIDLPSNIEIKYTVQELPPDVIEEDLEEGEELTYGIALFATGVLTCVVTIEAASVSILPDIQITYQEELLTGEVDIETKQANSLYILPSESTLKIHPGSFSGKINNVFIKDNTAGDIVEVGKSEIIGGIDYSTKVITMNTIDTRFKSSTQNLKLTANSCLLFNEDVDKVYATSFLFRTPAAPVVSESFSIRVTVRGMLCTLTANTQGQFSQLGRVYNGHINLQTGIVRFNTHYSTDITTIAASCVVSSNMPLNAKLLGLDPTRLPIDGKVEVLRDGDIILIHNSTQFDLPPNVQPDQVVNTGMTNLTAIDLFDNNGIFIPPNDNFIVSTTFGTIIFSSSFSPSGFTQPFYAMCRIEDMMLVNDVQVTGDMSCTSQITHDYPIENTYVSSVLPIGDMQARVYALFSQQTWTNVWSNERIGTGILAQYNEVNYPIQVVNKSATKERWACIFESSNTVKLVGEHLGIVATGLSILNDIKYPNDGNPFITIKKEGWGMGWATGNVLRFNTDAANFPINFCRATLQGPPTEHTDNYIVALRGDSS